MEIQQKIEQRIGVGKRIRRNLLIYGMPFAEERLDAVVHVPAAIEMNSSAGTLEEATKFVVEVEQARECPIDNGIPDYLGNHDPGIAHERILLFIGNEPDIGEDEKELVMRHRSLFDVLPIQPLVNQVADQTVANGNQISTGGIERVNSNRRLAGETPALARVDLLAAIGIVLHNAKI